MRSNSNRVIIFLSKMWWFLLTILLLGTFIWISEQFGFMKPHKDKEEVLALYECNKLELIALTERLMEERYEAFFVRVEYDDDKLPYAKFTYEDIEVDEDILGMCDKFISTEEFYSIYRDFEQEIYFFNVTSFPHATDSRKGLAFCISQPQDDDQQFFEHIEGNWYYYEEID